MTTDTSLDEQIATAERARRPDTDRLAGLYLRRAARQVRHEDHYPTARYLDVRGEYDGDVLSLWAEAARDEHLNVLGAVNRSTLGVADDWDLDDDQVEAFEALTDEIDGDIAAVAKLARSDDEWFGLRRIDLASEHLDAERIEE
jgi:hypothetical protein